MAPQPLFRPTGTPINIMLMCRALAEAGYEVHVATLPEGDDLPIRGLVMHRVRHLPFVKTIPAGFSFGKLLYDVSLALYVPRLLRRHRFEVVHAVEEAAFYAVPLARSFGLPAIFDLDSDIVRQLREHPSAFARILARPASFLRRKALRRASAALTINQHISQIVQAESPGTDAFEISDIPLDGAGRPPDPARIAAYRAELGLGSQRLVVYTGNYDRRQGLEELVRAMPEVLRRHPDAALVVVGGEPADVAALQAIVDRFSIGASVRLIGKRVPETMPEYMGMADVLVSPRLEPYATPLKIFSYMASGRPIVATDLPTHSVVLDGSSAILVPSTVAGLADGISRALGDREHAAQLGANAAKLVRAKFTYENFRCQLLAAYQSVLSQAEPQVPGEALGSGGQSREEQPAGRPSGDADFAQREQAGSVCVVEERRMPEHPDRARGHRSDASPLSRCS